MDEPAGQGETSARRDWVAVLAGGGLLVATMLVLAALASTSGALDPGEAVLDLAPWLRLEVLAGALVGLASGALARRIAGRPRAVHLLAGVTLAVGLLEASELLRQSARLGAQLHAPAVWVLLALFVGPLAVWLGGLRRCDLAGLSSRSPDVLRWAVPLGVMALAAGLLSQASRTPRPMVLAGAATLDLTFTVPALAWWTLVRSRRLPPIALVPFFVLGLALATLLVPAKHTLVLDWVRRLAVPLELLLVGTLAYHARRAWAASRGAEAIDFVDRLRGTARRALGNRLAAEVFTTEIALLRYAFRGARGDAPPAMTLARASGVGTIYIGLGLVILVETVPVHLLLSMASPTLAWVMTALSVYALVWLLGDYRALMARGVSVGPRRVRLRLGLRWELDFSRRDLLGVELVRPLPAPPRTALVLSAWGAPNVRLRLRRAYVARGFYGLRRRSDEIWLRMDDPSVLLRALEGPMAHCSTSSGPT